MKKYRKITALILAITLIAIPSIFSKASEISTPQPQMNEQASLWYDSNTDQYTAPYDKDSSEWNNAATALERKSLFQIPDSVLSNISTSNLLDLILTYPYLIEIIYYNSYTDGINALRENYSGVSELFVRSDAPSVVLDRYVVEPLDENLDSLLCNIFFETFLSHEMIINSFTKEDMQILNQETNLKYIQKQNLDYYSSFESVFYQGLEKTFDTNLKAPKSSRTISDVTLKTKKGETVYAKYYSSYEEMDHDTVNAVNTESENAFPTATLYRDASNLYNCHFFTWFRDYGLVYQYWVIDPSPFLKKDAVYFGTAPSKIGQNAIYWTSGGAADHSAYVYSYTSSTNYKLISKWGNGPVMIHSRYSCPYSSSYIKFYNVVN
ncbi:hypothetical protein [Anaerolentibacter hominis]|uniref:hypothetical protein n=1 Tax=Anaerolentibacter hominis TaxID=3079009 RepID=UPI0031B87F15